MPMIAMSKLQLVPPVPSRMTRRIFTTRRQVRLPEGARRRLSCFWDMLYGVHTSRLHIFGSTHEDPPDPPKTPLLEDSSAPSLYPSTYTTTTSETRRGFRGITIDAPYPNRASVWSAAELASAP